MCWVYGPWFLGVRVGGLGDLDLAFLVLGFRVLSVGVPRTKHEL